MEGPQRALPYFNRDEPLLAVRAIRAGFGRRVALPAAQQQPGRDRSHGHRAKRDARNGHGSHTAIGSAAFI